MKALKKAAAVFAAICMMLVSVCCAFAEEIVIFDQSASGDGIKDTDGAISVKGALLLDEGLPVTIIIASKKTDTDGVTDITKSSIENAATIGEFLALVEYTKTISVPEGGHLDLSFSAKDSMRTGTAYVFASFNGGDSLIKIGEFEHVGKDDVSSVVEKFNDYGFETYEATIGADYEDVNVLGKIGADVGRYMLLSDKLYFAGILEGMKPEGGFSSVGLIESFNEAIAWAELHEKADTEAVLGEYNGVYWNIQIGENSDFASLSEEEKATVLLNIKSAASGDGEALEKSFRENMAFARVRSVGDRNELTELLENSAYAQEFKAVNDALASSGLNEYKLISVYNYILERNDEITEASELEKLFKDAISAQKETSAGGSGGGGGGGGGSTHKPVLELPSAGSTEIDYTDYERELAVKPHPFSDVESKHWANEYIADMYKKGIISGKTENTFAPDEKIKRQDFVKMAVSVLGLEIVDAKSTFTDIEKGSFYEKYVMTAVKNKLISGMGENIFGMAQDIKREDVAVILSRVIAEKEAEGEEKEFADKEEISSYAKDAIALCSKCGLFTGDTENRINPKAGLSRAEAAALLCRLAAFMNE